MEKFYMILKERIKQKELQEDSGIADGSATSGTTSGDIATVDTCLNFAKKQQKEHNKALGTHKEE
jgi:hypothetical protein